MPDIDGTIYDRPYIPDDQSDNFLGFEVSVDGQPVKPTLEQKAFALGIDVRRPAQGQQRARQPVRCNRCSRRSKPCRRQTAQDWIDRGLLFIDSYDDGAGWKHVRTPLWSLKSTYWWNSTFPAGKEVKVSHRYKPSVGGTAGLTFFYDNKFGRLLRGVQACAIASTARFEKAVLKAAKESKDGYPLLMEQRLDYVLTTGGNWALGTIGEFKLTIDKGDPNNLVSFCGENVKKTGPTTFEMTAKDYYPEQDLKILILHPFEMEAERRRRHARFGTASGERGLGARGEPGPGGRAQGSKG